MVDTRPVGASFSLRTRGFRLAPGVHLEVSMPTSVKEFFDKRVPGVLSKHPEKATDVAAVYLFKISGPDGGIWTADLKSSPPTCVPGAVGSPQCTIEATDGDFRTMIDGGMGAAMQLFFSGKLKVQGDPSLATKLSKLLQMGAAG
jgi:SCP-2 sterol transfer family